MATKYKLTKEQIIAEWAKCGRDPIYFIKNYIKISHPQRGKIPFKTYDYQTDLIDVFRKKERTIILKGRQLGISTIVAAYVCWYMLFHQERTVALVSIKHKTSKSLIKKVRQMFKNLDPFMASFSPVNPKNDNVESFELENGSVLLAMPATVDAIRSYAVSLLVLDEAAFIDGIEDLWTAADPAFSSTGGSVIALSSPNGVGTWFYREFTRAEDGSNDFYPITLPWFVHPERDEAWYKKQIKGMSERQFAQEHGCSFNQSGETVISPSDIQEIKEKTLEPKDKIGFDRNLWIWDEYNVEHRYLISADVARGDGEDYSAYHVIDLDEMSQVAEYKGQLPYDRFARELYKAGEMYGFCMIVVENNNLGHSVCKELINSEYPNIYWSKKGSHEFVHHYDAESMDNVIPGFTTSDNTKRLVVGTFEEYIRNNKLKIKSIRTFNELKTFVWVNGKPNAMRGHNDDLIMSLAIGCEIIDIAKYASKKEESYVKSILGSVVVRGTTAKDIANVEGLNYDPKSMRLVRGDKHSKQKEIYAQYAFLLR